MFMKNPDGSLWLRRFGTAFLTWLVPFLVAIPFYSRDGTLLVDSGLFKSLMVVVSAGTAALLMVWFFSRAAPPYAREAAITGTIWLLVNWALDLFVLVLLLGMPLLDYLTQIGLRYLMIPVMVITAGIIADRARECDREAG